MKQSLDLHGYSHKDAEDQIDRFISSTEPPFEIITGNSIVMQKIVGKALNKYNLEAFYDHPNNLGSLTVCKRMR